MIIERNELDGLDRYTIEKRCISVEDVSGMLEKAEGCGTAGDVNFCLCKTDLCNRASLLQQARLQGQVIRWITQM